MFRSGNILKSLMVATLVAALTSACGFHLRGKFEISDELQNIYLGGPDQELIDALEQNLEFSDVTVSPSREGADAVLSFSDIDYERDVKTLDDRGRASSYQLTYRIAFNVKSADGETLLETSRLKLSRDLNFDATQVLQKEDEEDFLKEDMVKDAAQQIMRRLSKI